jgi:NADH:ubiquinone oxidoreductase subunit 4 (subunit M)
MVVLSMLTLMVIWLGVYPEGMLSIVNQFHLK